MCGRYNVIDDPLVQELMDELGISLYPPTRLNIAPGAKGAIVYQTAADRVLVEAYWSLLIERKPDGADYRPSSRYSTFNARSGSLGTSPLWKGRFRSQRAIVPASGFHEWVGSRGHKQCFNIRASGAAIAFAGLYEIWDFGGEAVPSFAIITLPGHPRFRHIHAQSLPLMLTERDFDAWLDPTLTDTGAFQSLLASGIRVPLDIAPVRSPVNLEVTGAEQHLGVD